MTKVYFEDLENKVISEISKAEYSLNIAVAWISFDRYYDTFVKLLTRGVNIQIIADDNHSNRRYQNLINALCNKGASIMLIKYPYGYMHQKVCIVDDKKCLFGSFNWSKNADTNNDENITISDELNVILEYKQRISGMWQLSNEDRKLLRNPDICEYCGLPMFNMLLMEQCGDYQTKVDVARTCSCRCKIIYEDYFDISVYSNLIAISEKYDDESALYFEGIDDEQYRRQQEASYKYEIEMYLSSVRFNRMGLPIIHAVGVKSYELIGRHDDRWFYKILWKENGTGRYIQDEYDLDQFI
ncbi:phospholipase D-like domain-containing protein [Oribacterium sp. NK2B42]|uniref:phospholipase D-like domain-containing protein n=1 Tax=Oribacterium sp. NK2B42 TaxID=689781 RepID=UPI00041ED4E4|nr:phospholipase D-like domain-containing protein [Oribacterium sp. NK2B42]